MNCIRCQGPLAYYERQICIKCISDENEGIDIDIVKLILKTKKANNDLWNSGHKPDDILDNAKILEGYYGTE